MDSYDNIRNNLVLTYHSKENLYNKRCDGVDRSDISIHEIVMSIWKGRISSFAGHRRMMKTYRGVTVLYKVDEEGKYVVITYYRVPSYKNKKVKKFSWPF